MSAPADMAPGAPGAGAGASGAAGAVAGGERVEEAIIRRAKESFERLPALEAIFERLILALAPELRAYCGLMPEVEIDSMAYGGCDEVLGGVASPSILLTCEAHGWGGGLVAGVETDLLFAMLETMLGGRGAAQGAWSPRSFSSIERAVGRRLCQIGLDTLAAACRTLAPVRFEVTALETTPQSVVLAPPVTETVRVRLKVQLESCEGYMLFVLPYGIYEPVRPLLSQPFLGGQPGAENAWRGQIDRSLGRTEVEVVAELHRLRLPLATVLGWRPGQVIDLGVVPGGEVVGRVAGDAVLRASYGRRRGGALGLKVNETYLAPDAGLGAVERQAVKETGDGACDAD